MNQTLECINDILCIDVLQNILSFDPILAADARLVCKTWNELSKLNAKIESNLREEAIQQELKINPLPQFNQLRTFTCNPSSIHHILDNCRNGDTIFLHNGDYYLGAHIRIINNIQLIGIGNNVRIMQKNCGALYLMMIEASVFIENIIFDSLNLDDCDTCVNVTGSLWIKNCTFKLIETAIALEHNGNVSTVNAFNCILIGGTSPIYIPFNRAGKFKPFKVSVIGCTFSNCGQESCLHYSHENACIAVETGWAPREASLMDLRCVGNIFRNTFCYPIAECHFCEDESVTDTIAATEHLCFLSNNVLEGFNALNIRETKDFVGLGPNTLYVNRVVVRHCRAFRC